MSQLRYSGSDCKDGHDIIVEGQSTQPIRIAHFDRVSQGVRDIVSYLNGQAISFEKHQIMLLKLLKASLDGRDQNRIQDEVAKMLGYPGIEKFIEENYGRLAKVNLSEVARDIMR